MWHMVDDDCGRRVIHAHPSYIHALAVLRMPYLAAGCNEDGLPAVQQTCARDPSAVTHRYRYKCFQCKTRWPETNCRLMTDVPSSCAMQIGRWHGYTPHPTPPHGSYEAWSKSTAAATAAINSAMEEASYNAWRRSCTHASCHLAGLQGAPAATPHAACMGQAPTATNVGRCS